MKKTLQYFFIIITILFMLVQPGLAREFQLDVESSILIDAHTGQVLFEKDADKRMPPASITKVMTLLVAMESIEQGEISLDDEVTISDFAESMGGSQIFLAAGTKVSVRDLLKAVTIASANDASVALGEAVAGSYNAFIEMMNEKAQELGMENTYFSNSTGLPTDSEHYSTARDISIMSRELVKYDKVLEWASIWVDYVELPDRRAMLANTNRLLNKYPGLDGLKTGHTNNAGFCLSATACRGDFRLISVVLNSNSPAERRELTTRLLDYGFNNFKRMVLAEKGQEISNIEIPAGAKPMTTGQVAEDLAIAVKKGQEGEVEPLMEIREDIQPPIDRGQSLGEIRAIKGEQTLSSVDIEATEDIKKANILVLFWRSLINWVTGLIP